MRGHDFALTVREAAEAAAEINTLQLPESFARCHSAKLDGYIVIAHVRAADIKRLLSTLVFRHAPEKTARLARI